MTRYRRKPVEVEATPCEQPGCWYIEEGGVGRHVYGVDFEREYEPVPTGVCSFGHASQAECEASDAREASLKLADELAEAAGDAFSNGRSYAVWLAQEGDHKGAASVRAEVEKAEAALTAYQESRGKR